MIIVDTSVLIDFFRGKDTPAAQIMSALDLREIPFAIPTLCCQELLQGAKTEREWSKLSEYLGAQQQVDLRYGWRSHWEAARIFFDCRRQGKTIRSSIDCIVAQIALEHDSELLHDDRDFDRIATVRALKTVGR